MIAFPSSTEDGSIEALQSESLPADTTGFRPQLRTAPLKPQRRGTLLWSRRMFPSSTEDGSIEARKRSLSGPSVSAFPSSTEDGSIEAFARCVSGVYSTQVSVLN